MCDAHEEAAAAVALVPGSAEEALAAVTQWLDRWGGLKELNESDPANPIIKLNDDSQFSPSEAIGDIDNATNVTVAEGQVLPAVRAYRDAKAAAAAAQSADE